MCEPTSIALVAIAVVGAVVGKMESDKAAKRQEDAITSNLEKDRAATAEQYKQIQETAMDDQAQLHTNYLIDSARIQAMQGESGLQGASHDRVALEAENNSNQDMATLEQNRKRQMTNAKTQGIAQASRAGVQLSGIKRQSNAGTALQIGGAVASAYAKPSGEGPVTKPQGWDNSFDNPDNYG